MREKLDIWMKEFRDAPSWKEAAAVATDFRTRFAEEMKADENIARFGKFATRIVYEHAPEELTIEKQEAMKRFIAAHVLSDNPKVPWVTVAKARAELEKIEEERKDPKKKDHWKEVTDSEIRSLKLYYTSIEKEYLPYLPEVKPSAQPPAAAAPVNDNPASAAPAAPAEPKKAEPPKPV